MESTSDVAANAVLDTVTPRRFLTPGLWIAAGVAGYYYGRGVKDPTARFAALAVSGSMVGFGVLSIFRKGGDFNRAVEGAAGLPPGADVSTLEKGLGLWGRITGQEPEAGGESSPDRGATEGPFLGTPKNAERVAGKIRSPSDGGTFPLPLYSDTFRVEGAVENQSEEVRQGRVEARVISQGLLQGEAQTLISPGVAVRLNPGQMSAVELRIPAVRDFDGAVRIALLWNGYKVDEITATRTFALW